MNFSKARTPLGHFPSCRLAIARLDRSLPPDEGELADAVRKGVVISAARFAKTMTAARARRLAKQQVESRLGTLTDDASLAERQTRSNEISRIAQDALDAVRLLKGRRLLLQVLKNV